MARRYLGESGWEEEEWDADEIGNADDDDDGADDLEDGDWDESEGVIDCPNCGAEIHMDAVRCPECENYISKEDAAQAKKPPWIVVGVVMALIAAALLIWTCW